MTEHAPYQGSAFPPPQALSGPARPLGVKAWIAMAGLGLIGAEALAGAAMQAFLYPVASGAADPTEAQIAVDNFLSSGERILAALLLLFAGVAFVSWLFRARANLDGAGDRALTWAKGWTIGGWLIPLANLVIPQLVVGEIDRITERRADEAEGRPHDRRRGVLVTWLVLWSLFMVVSQLGEPMLNALEPAPSQLLGVAFGVFEAATATSAILLVRRITMNQERIRRAWLRHGQGFPATPPATFPAAF